MGAVARTSKSIETTERPESPFRVLFDRAWKRINPGWFLVGWEVMIWSVIGWCFGAHYFGHYNVALNKMATSVSWFTPLALTPLLIGPLVYRVHAYHPTLDDDIRVLPISPETFLGARLMAVVYLWLRIFGPLLLLTIHLFTLHESDYGILERLRQTSNAHLSLLAYSIPGFGVNLESLRAGLLGILMFFTQIIGWFTLPMTWALYWGTRFRGNIFYYFATYFLYLAILGVLYFIARFIFIEHDSPMHLHWLPGYGLTWIMVMGLSGLLVSFILFTRSCALLWRRP